MFLAGKLLRKSSWTCMTHLCTSTSSGLMALWWPRWRYPVQVSSWWCHDLINYFIIPLWPVISVVCHQIGNVMPVSVLYLCWITNSCDKLKYLMQMLLLFQSPVLFIQPNSVSIMRCKEQVCDDIWDEYLTRREGTKKGKEGRKRRGRPSKIWIVEETCLSAPL